MKIKKEGIGTVSITRLTSSPKTGSYSRSHLKKIFSKECMTVHTRYQVSGITIVDQMLRCCTTFWISQSCMPSVLYSDDNIFSCLLPHVRVDAVNHIASFVNWPLIKDVPRICHIYNAPPPKSERCNMKENEEKLQKWNTKMKEVIKQNRHD